MISAVPYNAQAEIDLLLDLACSKNKIEEHSRNKIVLRDKLSQSLLSDLHKGIILNIFPRYITCEAVTIIAIR